ncbi:MAG: hypothetical protein KFH98_07020 [Gemmatimonadetes bacterium]|nr:hypothetical protein [Gemmatimonadota bacterium]
MFVLVHHDVKQPEAFWARSQEALGNLPRELTLHHCLAAQDGTRATCLWEAASPEAVSAFLDPLHDGVADNEYRAAENSEGIAVPQRYQIAPPASA